MKPPPSSPPRSGGLHRRHLLQLGALAGGGLLALSTGDARARVCAAQMFHHGVASGDPLPDGIVLWTRVTPTPEAQPGSGVGPHVPVRWELSDRPDFQSVVRSGRVLATAAADHTVKVDVRGLRPSTCYYYRFLAEGGASPVGRFRTTPAPDADVPRLRFGLVSCANYEAGFFSAYRHLAERDDLDAVLHLGDYLYEYGNGSYGDACADLQRCHAPATEVLSLADYRQRHATYKRDPDLQALHASAAFIVTWDDHETTNDCWRDGAENHDAAEGDYRTRKAAATRAYFEWMPLRPPAPGEEPGRLYRTLRFGRLAEVTMLDLRQYRDEQVPATDAQRIESTARTLTGRPQMQWLKAALAETDAQWKLVGNPVQLMPVRTPALPAELARALSVLTGGRVLPEGGPVFNPDAWDGYGAEQRELLGHLQARGVQNAVFLTGDIHSTWAADLPLDPGTYPLSPSLATEFVVTSVTSDNLDEILGVPPRTASLAAEQALLDANRHIRHVELDSHGYAVAEVTPERMQVDWYHVSDRKDPGARVRFAQAFETRAGESRVRPASAPLGARLQLDLDTRPVHPTEGASFAL